MTKREVLGAMTFGHRVAEYETASLAEYFVETDQWTRIFSGEIDIIYGSKGAGKSAIYLLLSSRATELSDRGIVLVPAENPRGALAFADVVEDPPTTEAAFRALWKLYFLALVGDVLRNNAITDEHAKRLYEFLAAAKLLEPNASLSRTVKAVMDYVKRYLNVQELEAGLKVDPVMGAPSVTGRITFREPSADERKAGFVSVDELIVDANESLKASDLEAWIILDRLDVAFAEVRELEENALRALFRVYLDFLGLTNVRLKIFLRDDIWERITEDKGFAEASHITRDVTLTWEPQSLLNLVVRRLVRNDALVKAFDVEAQSVLASMTSQRDLFYRVFSNQVNTGSKQSETFKWILSRTQDGAKLNTPRELIHLLEEARKAQLHLIEIGEGEPAGEALISPAALKAALPEVSRTRLEQTIFAEYPDLKKLILALEGGKTEQTVTTLAATWRLSGDQASAVAQRLVDIGFFELRGTKASPSYWVPFIYRPALEMVQGSADE